MILSSLEHSLQTNFASLYKTTKPLPDWHLNAHNGGVTAKR